MHAWPPLVEGGVNADGGGYHRRLAASSADVTLGMTKLKNEHFQYSSCTPNANDDFYITVATSQADSNFLFEVIDLITTKWNKMHKDEPLHVVHVCSMCACTHVNMLCM